MGIPCQTDEMKHVLFLQKFVWEVPEEPILIVSVLPSDIIHLNIWHNCSLCFSDKTLNIFSTSQPPDSSFVKKRKKFSENFRI